MIPGGLKPGDLMDTGCGVFYRGEELSRKGDVHPGHTHPYDHLHIVIRGSVRIDWYVPEEQMAKFNARNDGTKSPTGSREYKALAAMNVWGCVHHTITALEDNTAFLCVTGLRDATGVKCDEFNGDMTPYAEGTPRG